MAERRMIKRSVITEGAFRALSSATQMLYLHMMLGADDFGLVSCGRQYARSMGYNPKRLDELCEIGYLIQFASGVYAITHWNEHNKMGRVKHRTNSHPDILTQLSTDEQGRYVTAY